MRRIPVLIALMLLGACGGGDDGLDANGSAATLGPEAPAVTTEGKPQVASPGGAPPSTLQTRDLREGSGAEATARAMVSVHYVGVAWSTNEQFDASWDRGQPFSFALGAGQVIRGWDEGVAGMRVGGRRELIIPPDMAYGERGAGGVIGPNETLIFVVDLLDVQTSG